MRLAEFTAQFKQAFFEDCDTLRIKKAQHYPAATEERYIARMIEMIALLVSKGIAYQAEDKSLYFRLSKFPDYGKLAHLNLDELRPTGRISNDEYEKESIGDFALWKAWDEQDGDVFWESPWGRGRPGWHIECSAMATALLGPEIDLHCGGVDNIFPHHEAEIAQSECCTGRKFVRYWLHCAHLRVEGEKMSKSLGNFFTLRDLLAKGYSGRELRFELLRVNYRLPLNFTLAGLDGARVSLARLDEWAQRIAEHAVRSTSSGPAAHSASSGLTAASGPAGGAAPEPTPLSAHAEEFLTALDADLNISGALGHLFELVRESNRALDERTLTPGHAAQLLADWQRLNRILALEPEAASIPAEVLALVEERQQARAAKEWKRSDELRDAIAATGWDVKDTKQGPKLTRR
jgi:cysteinyl-tRNA synthetase